MHFYDRDRPPIKIGKQSYYIVSPEQERVWLRERRRQRWRTVGRVLMLPWRWLVGLVKHMLRD